MYSKQCFHDKWFVIHDMFYQILHTYLEDDSVVVSNETALKLGCLEMRRFFRDMAPGAIKRKENFVVIE